MSTKTSTIKRIALVAVAALGFGMLSGVSANAAGEITFAGAAGVSGAGTSLANPFVAATGVAVTINSTGTPAISVSNTVSVSPALPAGLSLNSSTGVISGTPTGTLSTTSFVVSMDGSPSKTGTFYLNIQGVVVSSNDQPWRAVDGSGTFDPTTKTLNVASTALDTSTLFKLKATSNSNCSDTTCNGLAGSPATGDYRYLKITSGNSTFSNATSVWPTDSTGWVLNGTLAAGSVSGADYVPGTATLAYMPTDGLINNNEFHVRTATAGTVTLEFREYKAVANPVDATQTVVTDTLLQTIKIVVTAPGALDISKSTSIINANTLQITAKKAAGDLGGHVVAGFNTTDGDETVLAAKAVNGLSTTTDAVAVVKVTLRDAAGTALINSGANPTVGASVSGPGTVSIAYSAAGASQTGTAGRNISLASPVFTTAGTFYVNIFSDGNGGKSTITITVGGVTLATETLSFYGAVTKVAATQGLYVLPTGTVAGGTYGCTLGLNCTGLTVGTSAAVALAATDADGIAVPYLTYSVASSDAGVLTGNATAGAGVANVPYAGVNHFQVTVPYAATASSGKSATLTYTTGTVSSNALTFTLGGAAASVSIAFTGITEVGTLNAISVTAKDAAGNKAYDKDHTAKLTSNVVINTAVNADQLIFTATGANVPVWNGTGSVKFYNPIVPTNLVIGGTIGGAAVSATTAVNNSAIDAATDAAAEAIDAANAATDAANLAAEAADAATVAAEEARDAADAATAAIEELATQVAALIAALQAQIKTLANTVAKIAKKVKA